MVKCSLFLRGILLVSLSAAICFFVCHQGAANHFAVFTEHLMRDGYEVHIFAAEPVIKPFQDRGIVATPFSIKNLSDEEKSSLADELATLCSTASAVLTDVGDLFEMTFQKALKEKSPRVLRLAYRDNPEHYVPEPYLTIATKVMLAADRVLFANANMAQEALYQDKEQKEEIPLPFENRIGLGYSPLAQAEKLALQRKESHETMQKQLLDKYGAAGRRALVYFGGNNPDYFNKAFPAFLKILSQSIEKGENLSDLVIFLQQHPKAKEENLDRKQLEIWIEAHRGDPHAPRLIISSEKTPDLEIAADAALFHQTSLTSSWALAGLPMMQIGDEPDQTIIVKAGLCPSVTDAAGFIEAIKGIKPKLVSEEEKAAICARLGIREDWFATLKQALGEKKD